MPDLLEQPQPIATRKRNLFTVETARAFAIKSHAPGSARYRKPVAEPEPAPAQLPVEPAQAFADKRLSRVREQLDRIDALMFKETDSKELKFLADASTRLSAQEFDLAGRPKSGTRKVREDRARVSAGWIELQPALPGLPTPVPNQSSAGVSRPLGWEYDDPNAAPREPDKLPGDVTP